MVSKHSMKAKSHKGGGIPRPHISGMDTLGSLPVGGMFKQHHHGEQPGHKTAKHNDKSAPVHHHKGEKTMAHKHKGMDGKAMYHKGKKG
jgi:hypothetical protein